MCDDAVYNTALTAGSVVGSSVLGGPDDVIVCFVL